MFEKTFKFHLLEDIHPPIRNEILGWYKDTVDGTYYEIITFDWLFDVDTQKWNRPYWTNSYGHDVEAPYSWAYMYGEPEVGE